MTLDGARLARCRSCDDTTLIFAERKDRCLGCRPAEPREPELYDARELPEPDLDPQHPILDLFAEAQSAIPLGRQVASLLGVSGSMHIAWTTWSGRRPRRRRARPRASRVPRPVLLASSLCLLCGLLPQEYGSCRCGDCNHKRQRKRNHKRLWPRPAQGLSP